MSVLLVFCVFVFVMMYVVMFSWLSVCVLCRMCSIFVVCLLLLSMMSVCVCWLWSVDLLNVCVVVCVIYSVMLVSVRSVRSECGGMVR